MKLPPCDQGPKFSAKCEWLYNYRGYRCAATAKWQTMCLMEDGTLKNWKLCDTHKSEVGTVAGKANRMKLPPCDHDECSRNGCTRSCTECKSWKAYVFHQDWGYCEELGRVGRSYSAQQCPLFKR